MMDTVIVVPTFGQEEFTARCFSSIFVHTQGHKLIWVDNGSSAESRDVVIPSYRLSSCRERIWEKKNLGFVKAVNLGLRAALLEPRAKYIVIQNNDTIVTAGWLDRMRAIMRNNPKIGAVGPITTYGAKQQVWRFIWEGKAVDVNDSAARQKALASKYGDSFQETPIVTFFCTMFRRDVFDELGLLDEDYGVGLWDDQDLCAKMRKAGWKIAVAMGAYVRHFHRTTFKSVYSVEQIENMKKNNQKIFAKKMKERNA
jgi:GT2 family glycosyltransferase